MKTLKTLFFAVSFFTPLHAATDLDCGVYYETMQGSAGEHRLELRNFRALIDLVTPQEYKNPQGQMMISREKKTPGQQALLDTLQLGGKGTPYDMPMSKLRTRVVHAITSLKREDLEGTDEAFQRAVNLIKKWESEYSPELVNRRVFGILRALQERQFTKAEVQIFNDDIKAEHQRLLAGREQEMENSGGAPSRSGFSNAVRNGRRPAPVSGSASGIFIGESPEDAAIPTGSRKPR